MGTDSTNQQINKSPFMVVAGRAVRVCPGADGGSTPSASLSFHSFTKPELKLLAHLVVQSFGNCRFKVLGVSNSFNNPKSVIVVQITAPTIYAGCQKGILLENVVSLPEGKLLARRQGSDSSEVL